MGGATRFMTLLTTPFQPLRPSLHLLRRSLSAVPLRPITISSPSKLNSHTPQLVTCFHSQSNNSINNTYSLNSAASQPPPPPHPWPEWTNFLNILSSSSENPQIPPEDAFVVYEQLPDHFVRAAAACLAFARSQPNLLGLLSRRDIEAVVSNGTPFLFKSAIDTAGRMRAFLGTDESNVSEFDKANTADLMKYILSYASNPSVSSERSGLYSRELVDSSVRNLLQEMVTISCGPPAGHVPASDLQFSGRQRQISRPLGQNIEMKRGDWICPKCNFMNFARNTKCLECEESRPKKQLTGGEWECPQCNFFNYGRNSVCLRCDCRRPGSPLFNIMSSGTGSGYNGDRSVTADPGTKFSPSLPQSSFSDQKNSLNSGLSHVPLEMSTSATSERRTQTTSTEFQSSTSQTDQNKETEQVERTERWFKRIAELHDAKDLPSAISDEDFPEIMPMRKGENRFVVSKKKDRSLTSPKYKRQVAIDQTDNTTFVPFVPFPPGYFAKKDTEQPGDLDATESNKPTAGTNTLDDSRYEMSENKPNSSVNLSFSHEAVANTSALPRRDNQPMHSATTAPPDGSYVQSSTTSCDVNNNTGMDKYQGNEGPQVSTEGASAPLPENENFRSSWTGKSLEGSAVKETDPLDMSEEAKAERWFKRVAQIKDISELSQIPDEDFPSIMPMRKGVNRFVVSKRKTPLERRLTSQQYRRNLPIVTTDPSSKRDSDNS